MLTVSRVLTSHAQNGTALFINDVAYTSPSVPVLLQIMSGAKTASELLPSGSVYVLPSNSSIELSFPIEDSAGAGAPHPFHLHGVSNQYLDICR